MLEGEAKAAALALRRVRRDSESRLLTKRSVRGTQVVAIFYTLIETCILCGCDPPEYLRFIARAALRLTSAGKRPRFLAYVTTL